jgi:AraC-like DNA-binding protein
MLVRTPLKIILAAVPLLLLFLVVPLETTKRLTVFPGNQSIGFYAYTDETSGGASRSDGWNLTNGELHFRFVLEPKLSFPYANLGLSCVSPAAGLDISSYQTVELRMSAAHTRSVALTLKTRRPGASRFLTVEAAVSPEPATRSYRLAEFDSPAWWFAENGIDPDKVGPPDFRKLEAIEFAVGVSQPVAVEEEYSIASLAFVKDYTALYACLAASAAAYYLALLIFSLRRRIRKAGAMRRMIAGLPVTPLRLESRADQEAKKVFEFIHGHYIDSDLTLRRVNAETGVSEAKISKMIKKNAALSFRQYLNAVRVQEAKRLMLETDRQVTEIAYAVGYASLSHFNRIFKQLESIPPTQFRKREKT